ncbi:MAG: hypothetical protein P8J20_01555 [Novosphingobium sp.]|nr:hypothetical protein [Novosphingobium sp.]
MARDWQQSGIGEERKRELTDEATQSSLSLVQVALNSASVSGSLRLYAELFGFENAGGSAAWGDVLAMQDLPVEAHCLVWWMVGKQPFFQLEIFHHGFPEQRLLPADWKPSDHGWVRIGVAVSDFDRVVKALARLGVPVIGESGSAPKRRLAFRDPYAGIIVETIEQPNSDGPSVTYATSSVADLDRARAFYAEVVGAEIRPLEELHAPEDEALWGLAGAIREGFLACLPGGNLEIIRYTSPEGRMRRSDHRSSDQGMLNIALGSRDPEAIRALIARIHASGLATTHIVDTGTMCGTYVVEAGFEIEMLSIPPELDAALGFTPSASPFVNDVGG